MRVEAGRGATGRGALFWMSLLCLAGTSACKNSSSKNKSVSHNDSGRFTYVIDEPVIIQQGQMGAIADTSTPQAVQNFVNKSNARCYFLYENTNENLNLGLEKDRRQGISRVIARPFLTQYAIPDDVLLLQLRTQPELAQFANAISGKGGTPGLTTTLVQGSGGPVGLTGDTGITAPRSIDAHHGAKFLLGTHSMGAINLPLVYRLARDHAIESNAENPNFNFYVLTNSEKITLVVESLKEFEDLYPELVPENLPKLFARQAANVESLPADMQIVQYKAGGETPDTVDKVIDLTSPQIFVDPNPEQLATFDGVALGAATGAGAGSVMSLAQGFSLAPPAGVALNNGQKIWKALTAHRTFSWGWLKPISEKAKAVGDGLKGTVRSARAGLNNAFPTVNKVGDDAARVASTAASNANNSVKAMAGATNVTFKKVGKFFVKSGKDLAKVPGSAAQWLGKRLNSLNVARVCYDGKGLSAVLGKSACLSAIGGAAVFGYNHYFNNPQNGSAPEADPSKLQTMGQTGQGVLQFQAGMAALTPSLTSEKAEHMVAYQTLLIQLGSQPNGPSCENLKTQLKFRYWGDAK